MFGKKKPETEVKTPESKQSFSISSYTMPVKSEGRGLAVEDIREIIAEWLKSVHTKFKTRLTKRQVRGITKVQPMADRYHITCLQITLDEFRIAKLSEEGQSSKELVDILRERISNFMDQEGDNSNSLGRFFE